MVWMKTFCFYCSVRLGVIVSSIIAIIELLVPLILFFVYDTSLLNSTVKLMKEDNEYSEQLVVKKLMNMLSNYPAEFIGSIEAYLIIHIIASALAINGALKLAKWLLVPFGILELLRFLVLLTSHIIGMIVLKKVLDLGILIAATIFGGFVILFVGYRWAGVVAFFQICKLVHSDKYRALYGDDPLNPIDPEGHSQFGNNIIMIPPARLDDTFRKIRLKEKGVATIPVYEPDIKLAVTHFQNWYMNELMPPRKSNPIRFY